MTPRRRRRAVGPPGAVPADPAGASATAAEREAGERDAHDDAPDDPEAHGDPEARHDERLLADRPPHHDRGV